MAAQTVSDCINAFGYNGLSFCSDVICFYKLCIKLILGFSHLWLHYTFRIQTELTAATAVVVASWYMLHCTCKAFKMKLGCL